MEGRYRVESDGSPIALVVSVQPATDGTWQITVDGPQALTATLAPTRLILRLWRGDNGTLRGTIRRQGSDTVAPFQCNEQLQRLVSEWLWPK